MSLLLSLYLAVHLWIQIMQWTPNGKGQTRLNGPMESNRNNATFHQKSMYDQTAAGERKSYRKLGAECRQPPLLMTLIDPI